MKNTLELKDSINQMVLECRSIVDKCKQEQREMDEEEKKRFDELKEDIENKKRELQDLEEELKSYEEELPNGVEDEDPDEKEEKNKRNHRSMENYLVKELRNALDTKNFNIQLRTITVNDQGSGKDVVAGVHDNVVATELQKILEPLYANTVLGKLGVRWYKGLPQGDISVPIMGKGTTGWADEIATASASHNTFSNVTLSPKRLTSFVDISKMLIVQDALGAEEAIRRDIVNALYDKLEATILGDDEATSNKPAGIFNGATITTNNTYAKIADAEATVETANVGGEMKYLMAPSTKSFYRTLQKGNGVGFVLENGEMDGVGTVVTSNIAANKYVYGNFNYLAVAQFGGLDITVDPYTTAANGTIRLVINSYWDAKILRPEAFVFGQSKA